MIIKKNFLVSFITAIVVFMAFLGLSLSCASPPPPSTEPKIRININDLNAWLKNYEVDILFNNGLTPDQLMEVTKLCIATGELRMRITNVIEIDSVNRFNKILSESEFESYRNIVINKFKTRLEKIGNTVLVRSGDFA